MAATPTDTSVASAVVGPRWRGKSKAPNFKYTGPVSVIPLELDTSDVRLRRRLEGQWEAVFRLRRALQRDAAARCRAYRAAHHERGADPKAARARLGLSRKAMQAAAKAHIEASGWMRDHMTKAVGLHVAGEVWETVDRHLFADKPNMLVPVTPQPASSPPMATRSPSKTPTSPPGRGCGASGFSCSAREC